ncbi:hypothetical protein CYMTET_55112 [Cymbomonas tetramitiformis]|uniref:RING-type domain-containing protein n=1 Tax=Cymbomonas tetramitiformis TaxID=36881 RepID=A0AAE0EN84_9CHLO|nr:hypothetical protein CYMTET_55112 [Cymbomonas tetramitiformis]
MDNLAFPFSRLCEISSTLKCYVVAAPYTKIYYSSCATGQATVLYSKIEDKLNCWQIHCENDSRSVLRRNSVGSAPRHCYAMSVLRHASEDAKIIKMKPTDVSYVIGFFLSAEGTTVESVLTLLEGSARVFYSTAHTQVYEVLSSRRGPRRCLRTFAENVLTAAVCHDSVDVLRYMVEEIMQVASSDRIDKENRSSFRDDDEIIAHCTDAFRQRGLFGDEFRVKECSGETILHQASRSENIVWIRVLLESVWPLNSNGFRRYLEFKSKTDQTPLITAVAAFRVEQAELLIARGASLSSITRLSNLIQLKCTTDRKNVIRNLKATAVGTSGYDTLNRMHRMLVQTLEKADQQAANQASALCRAAQSDSCAAKSRSKGRGVVPANSEDNPDGAGLACAMPDERQGANSRDPLTGATLQACVLDVPSAEGDLTVSCTPFSTATVQCSSSLGTDLNDHKLCVICLDAEKDVAFIPCGHVVLCWGCASVQDLQSCPVCRQKKESIIRVYI